MAIVTSVELCIWIVIIMENMMTGLMNTVIAIPHVGMASL